VQKFDYLIRAANGARSGQAPILAGNSVVAHAVRQMVALAADSPDPLLLTGPDATPHTAVAKAIHTQSAYPDDPFIAVDCGNFSDDYFAVRWEGTLLLHNIAALDVSCQHALLRWMGSDDGQHVKTIVSTPLTVEQFAISEILIEPLKKQLAAAYIPCPTLAQRKGDIPVILQRLWADDRDQVPPVIDRAVWTRLLNHDWSSGFAELCDFAQRASRTFGGRNVSAEQIGQLLGAKVGREMGRPDFNLKQHLAKEERLYLIEALLRSNDVVQQAAGMAGLKRTTFLAKMKRHGLARI
jgi:DNA-binding NtrC family response regulator